MKEYKINNNTLIDTEMLVYKMCGSIAVSIHECPGCGKDIIKINEYFEYLDKEINKLYKKGN